MISAIIKSLNFAIHSWIYDVLLCCYDIRIVNFPFIIGFMMFCYAVMTFELSIFHCEILTCNYGNIHSANIHSASIHSASIHSASIHSASHSETKILLPLAREAWVAW